MNLKLYHISLRDFNPPGPVEVGGGGVGRGGVEEPPKQLSAL